MFDWIFETETFKKLDDSLASQVSNLNPSTFVLILNVIVYVLLAALVIYLGIKLYKLAKKPTKDLVEKLRKNLDKANEDSKQKSTILTLLDQVNDEIKDSIYHQKNGNNQTLYMQGLKIMEFISSQLPLSLKSTKSINHRCAVFVPDPEDNSVLKVLEGCGYSIKGKERLRLDKIKSVAGKAYTHGEYNYVKDVTKSKDFVKHPKQTKTYYSLLCYPIKVEGEIVAVLSIDGSEKDCFTKDDIGYVKMFSNQIGVIFSLVNYNIEENTVSERGLTDDQVQKSG